MTLYWTQYLTEINSPHKKPPLYPRVLPVFRQSPQSAHGRLQPIAVHNLNVSFLRNGNHFPDSGRHRAALQ